MRNINEIIIHCSDTPNFKWFDASDIRSWHRERGWSDIGYHDVILISGEVQEGRPIRLIGAHCRGKNRNSIGICLIGRDKFKQEQLESLEMVIKSYQKIFGNLKVSQHSEYDNKKPYCASLSKGYISYLNNLYEIPRDLRDLNNF